MMQGKTVVITGATSGVGQAAALNLARQGARIVFIARNKAKAEAMLAHLNAANPDAGHIFYLADFERLADVKRVGAEIAAQETRIDVLVNNAGNIYTTRAEVADGLERSFSVNHMAPFILTNALLDNVKATPNARIVFTASTAHSMGGPLRFDDLQSLQDYKTLEVYGRSKLCNVYVAQELARRLQGSGVSVNYFCPGYVDSGLGSDNFIGAKEGKPKAGPGAKTPEQGADTLVWLAGSDETANLNGGYFKDRKPGDLAPYASDAQTAARLWKVSEEIAVKIKS
jgi:NAD(P)-dependent dehydrogenase (short-subunit alcohol dehydrogenase family)